MGAWTATDVASVMVAADARRLIVDLQHHGGDAVFISFGVDPTLNAGLRLSRNFPMMSIKDQRAALEIRGVCASGQSASGGYAKA